MKNARSLFFITAVLLLCSFADSPSAILPVAGQNSAIEDSDFGGAYLVFAEKFGGEVTTKEIAGQKELKVNGCAAGSKIFTYTLVVTHAGKSSTYSAKSCQLTSEMLASLKVLQPGDYFEFQKTKAYLPNGKDEVEVHSRRFVVV